MRPLTHFLSALALLLLAGCGPAEAPERPLTVFAAASLTDVLQRIGPAFTEASGIEVRFSFAASSALARQIESGARADVFLSADQEWMDYLAARGAIDPDTRSNLLTSRLALIAPRDSDVSFEIEAGGALEAALGPAGRLAVADPDFVPAGRYARSALVHYGAWGTLEPRLVRADNVRVALMYVARSEVPLGIVYATDAAAEPRVRIVDLFPEASHEPITYPVAAVSGAAAEAARFLAFLESESAVRIFEQAGFGRAQP